MQNNMLALDLGDTKLTAVTSQHIASAAANAEPIIILGNEAQTGCYILRMVAREPLAVSFGRFQGGQPITVPQGEIIYIGSAMAAKGASTLARRLLRHATRANNEPPHPLREPLLSQCHNHGLGPIGLLPPAKKRLRWHVDYLLQETAVTLTQIIILRTAVALETNIAHLLENDAHTTPLAPGLGATDHPGHTHLLQVTADAAWWQQTMQRLSQIMVE